MGFLFGFLVAIPVGIYFGENNLSYPVVYKTPQNKERKWGSVILDLRFMDDIEKRYHSYL